MAEPIQSNPRQPFKQVILSGVQQVKITASTGVLVYTGPAHNQGSNLAFDCYVTLFKTSSGSGFPTLTQIGQASAFDQSTGACLYMATAKANTNTLDFYITIPSSSSFYSIDVTFAFRWYIYAEAATVF